MVVLESTITERKTFIIDLHVVMDDKEARHFYNELGKMKGEVSGRMYEVLHTLYGKLE